MAKYLIDTCVLINVARGRSEEVRGLDGLSGAVVSYVTYGELVQGARNKRELKMIDEIVSGYTIDGGDIKVWQKALEILKTYHHSDGVGLMDAIIAAQAIVNNWTLITENLKHFKMIEGITVKNLSEVVK